MNCKVDVRGRDKKQENCVEWSVSHGIFGVKLFAFFSTPNKLIKFLRVLQKKVNKKIR